MAKRKTLPSEQDATGRPAGTPGTKPRNIKAKTASQAIQQKIRESIIKKKRPGGPPSKREVSRQIDSLVLRYDALDLKRRGYSWRQIGAQLKISHVHARRLVYQACGEIAADEPNVVAHMRTIEDERLDEALRVTLPLAYGMVPDKEVASTVTVPDEKDPAKQVVKTVVRKVKNDPVEIGRLQLQGVARLTEISESRRRLHGVDRPTKVAATDPSGERSYGDLTEEQLDALIAEREAEAFGRAIDVTPRKNGGHGNGNGNGAGR